MPFRTPRAFHPFMPVALTSILLAACAQPAPEAPKPQGKSNATMVADIQAAGERDKSVINVHPLVDPGITALQDAARNDERNGQYDAAAAKLDQALKRSSDSPDVLQDRAELAIYMGNYDLAENSRTNPGRSVPNRVRCVRATGRPSSKCVSVPMMPPALRRPTRALRNAASPAFNATKPSS